MNTDNFAIWKFKNIEGVLQDFYAYDFLVTKYQKDYVVFFMHYDLSTNTIKFESKIAKYDGVTCSFNDVHATLKQLGVFALKNRLDCHDSATWNNKLFEGTNN